MERIDPILDRRPNILSPNAINARNYGERDRDGTDGDAQRRQLKEKLRQEDERRKKLRDSLSSSATQKDRFESSKSDPAVATGAYSPGAIAASNTASVLSSPHNANYEQLDDEQSLRLAIALLRKSVGVVAELESVIKQLRAVMDGDQAGATPWGKLLSELETRIKELHQDLRDQQHGSKDGSALGDALRTELDLTSRYRN